MIFHFTTWKSGIGKFQGCKDNSLAWKVAAHIGSMEIVIVPSFEEQENYPKVCSISSSIHMSTKFTQLRSYISVLSTPSQSGKGDKFHHLFVRTNNRLNTPSIADFSLRDCSVQGFWVTHFRQTNVK